jgi:hypothetical protein
MLTRLTLAAPLFLSACGAGSSGRPAPAAQHEPAAQVQAAQSPDGKVYSAEECIGPVIMGVCHGTILPRQAYHPTCYGAWLDGACTGPMF